MRKNDSIEGIITGAQVGIKNFAIPAVDMFVTQYPEWMVPWLIARGFFGSLFDFQQEKINSFVEFLNENKGKFSEDIVKTDEFQEGFVVAFENYMRQRGAVKRKLIEDIFLDYTITINKDNFELERLMRNSELISINSIRFLGFLQTNVFPNWQTALTNQSAIQTNVSEQVGTYLRGNQDLDNKIIIDSYEECFAELTTLGIMRVKNYKTITDKFDTNVVYSFTEFGLKFIKYGRLNEKEHFLEG